MCGPVAIAIAGAAMSAASTITAGMAASNQANYQAQVDKMNAQAAAERSRDAVTRGEDQLRQHQQQSAVIAGNQRAALAANGIDPGSGSALDFQIDTQQNIQEDSYAITRNFQRERQGLLQQSSNYMADAAAQKSKASGALIGTAFGVASSVLGGATQVGSIRAKQAQGLSGW